MIDLPHISNFTDFDAFGSSPTCGCGSSREPADLDGPTR